MIELDNIKQEVVNLQIKRHLPLAEAIDIVLNSDADGMISAGVRQELLGWDEDEADELYFETLAARCFELSV